MVPSLTEAGCGRALHCVVRCKDKQQLEKAECGEGICLCPPSFPPLPTFTALLCSVLCGHGRRNTRTRGDLLQLQRSVTGALVSVTFHRSVSTED